MNNSFMKSKKYIVIALFVVAAILSVIFMNKVVINYNISDYLDEDTETKISLDIIEKEFGVTGDVQVMVEEIDVDTAKDIKNILSDIPNVLVVNFDENSENYFKDGKALFVILADGDEYSDVANQVVADVKAALDTKFEGKVNYGGAVIEKADLRAAMENEIPFILAVAICLTIAIMLITSRSWLEPIVLLLASGVAVLINMGTNLIFGEISYITNAVAAILQLALSIDYSIMLLHSYRAIKANGEEKNLAMKKAVKEVWKPVSASALTTIAGLLALLFMSMRIGFDIGIVLMKGIVISAITSMTLLPAILLICDKIMSKTEKRELIFNGKRFCKLSFKAGKVIVPVALAVIIACGALQFGNTYTFTDSESTDTPIINTFGKNNSVIVVYPNGENDLENEAVLAQKLTEYKTGDGKYALKSYTAYSNTVRELYNVEKAMRKMGLDKSSAELLIAMYNLYNNKAAVKLSPMEFVEYTNELIENDSDIEGFTSEEMITTIRTLLVVDELMNGNHTAEEFHTLATTGVMEGTKIDLFSIKQMYGLYHYESIENKSVDFLTMLNFMIAASGNEKVAKMLDAETVAKLTALSAGIEQFNAQMEMPLDKTQFKGYMYQNYGVALNDTAIAQIYAGYYMSQGLEAQDTIPFIKLMSFLVSQNIITDPTATATINGYASLYATVKSSCTYENFIPTLSGVATALTGQTTEINTSALSVQQIYIMYFYQINAIPEIAVSGREFVDFVNDSSKTNPVVSSQLSDEGKAKLADICVADMYLADTATYTFEEMSGKITELKGKTQSMATSADISRDKISGVYIKYALKNAPAILDGVVACDLLDFICENMDTNELLKSKMNDDNRAKVQDAKDSIVRATDLFISDNYSRMILSVDLPSESEESFVFVEYLLASVKEVLGDDAHIAGSMISTYDLDRTFESDNRLISIFTVVSIFLIVMIIFRSLSLPIVLVAVIQGAIWICMSTSLITGPMFFMSYIVATCILMGATIDYGILMSSNYVEFRKELDKKEALGKAVKASMPTVFTSGMILTICGFVIGFIASQNAISTVGILLGKGTLVSVLMITLVLPSVLYLLDKFIIKLTYSKKK